MLGKEPAVILGALAEVVKAIIPMLIIFNFINWTGEQVAQVMLVVGVAIGFFNVLLTRNAVVPTEKANSQIATAINMPATTAGVPTTVEQVITQEERDSK